MGSLERRIYDARQQNKLLTSRVQPSASNRLVKNNRLSPLSPQTACSAAKTYPPVPVATPILCADLAAMSTNAHRQQIPDLPDGPVQVVIFDFEGVPRGKLLTRSKLLSALDEGLGFCNVVFGWDIGDATYDNTSASGWASGYPDATVQLYPHTLRRIPWQQDLPLIIGDFGGGALAEVCPRTCLRRVLAKAADLDLDIQAAVEYEWFNFRETPSSLAAKRGAPPQPLTPGMHGYSLLRPAAEQAYFRSLWDGLTQFGVPLEGLHTETGPGVYEIAPVYTSALEAADRAALLKLGIKQIALTQGVVASFMAKWSAELPGCGGHVHQSLRRLSTGEALGFDASRPHQMSEMFGHYLAGQLHALPLLMPLLAPNINSYKRYVPGSWAATALSWGVDNRTAALRVVGNSASSLRLEHRVPGADANPYLALAAMVAAGVYGIEHELPLEMAPLQGNAYTQTDLRPLPRSLAEATELLRAETAFAKTLFGAPLVEHLLQTRDWECRQHQAAVTDWELRRYFELV